MNLDLKLYTESASKLAASIVATSLVNLVLYVTVSISFVCFNQILFIFSSFFKSLYPGSPDT